MSTNPHTPISEWFAVHRDEMQPIDKDFAADLDALHFRTVDLEAIGKERDDFKKLYEEEQQLHEDTAQELEEVKEHLEEKAKELEALEKQHETSGADRNRFARWIADVQSLVNGAVPKGNEARRDDSWPYLPQPQELKEKTA